MIPLDDEHIEIAAQHVKFNVEEFTETDHIIIGTYNGGGAVGVEIHEEYCWITFLYGDGKISTHKQLAGIGLWLFKFYTMERGKPVLYTGDVNKYMHNSHQLDAKVWQFIPKQYLCYNKNHE